MEHITHTVAIEYIGQLGGKYRVHATPKHAAGEFWKNGMNYVKCSPQLQDARDWVASIFGTTGIKVIEV